MTLRSTSSIRLLTGILAGASLLSFKGYATSLKPEYHWTFKVENQSSSAIKASVYVFHNQGRREDQAEVNIAPGETKELTSNDESKYYAQNATIKVNGVTCDIQRQNGTYKVVITNPKYAWQKGLACNVRP